jgi:putative NADH-flavin reductase
VSNLVVFGANGATGHVIIGEALRAGHTVTAAVRDPSTFSAPVKVVQADIRDHESVHAAVAGHDAVISAIGPAGRKAEGLYSAAARTFVDAGIHRLVALSSSGARSDDPNHPLWYRVVARTLMSELYGDMRLMEDIVRDSALDWTFVRPARIVDEPPTGDYRVLDGVNPEGGTKIPRVDLARFVVAAVSDKHWSYTCPTIAQ